MPLPPVGVLPVNAAGVEPVQIDCAAAMVLVAITGFTVTVTVELLLLQDATFGDIITR